MRRDTGQATLELAACLPFVLAAMLACVQVFVAVQTGILADQAALAVLRAHRAGADVDVAARAVLGPQLGADLVVRVDDEESTVEVRMPALLPLPDALLTVQRSVSVGPEAG